MSQLGGMGATPARRSTRLSQAGSVTQQSIVTTLTTGGTRQRKKAPLTKVKPRKSNAYGASGRVGAAEELAPTATGFAQAFQNQRGDAVARDDGEDEEEDDVDELGAETPRMSGALNGRLPHLSPTPQPETTSPIGPGLSFMDSEDIHRSESGIDASVGNTSKSFGPNHEAGMLYRPMRMEPPQVQAQDDDDGVWRKPLWQQNRARRFNPRQEERDEIEAPIDRPKGAAPVINKESQLPIQHIVAQEQARLQREGPPGPRNSSRKHPAQPGPNNANVDIWLGGVEEAEEDEREWKWKTHLMRLFWFVCIAMLLAPVYNFATSTEYPESTLTPGIIDAVGARISHTWYGVVDWISPSGTGFQKQITKELLEKTGFVTKDTFDKAIISLTENFPHFLIIRRHADGTKEVTDEFWHALMNKAISPEGESALDVFLKQNEKRAQNIFGKTISPNAKDPHPEVVSRDEFVRLLEAKYQKMLTQISPSQIKAIEAVARAETRKAMIDAVQIDALAKSNLIENYKLNLGKVNYFSTGLGALVDPFLSSTTFYPGQPSFARSLLARLPFGPLMIKSSRLPNPPTVALEKWEEPGDCWCAAPNPRRGTAQLVVKLYKPLFPLQVTIEHLPKDMMPNRKIANAPRTVELWTETDQSAKYEDVHQQGGCQEGPAGWTCLGFFEYNIHAFNHYQTFDLGVQSSVPVTRVMLRVMSNWGADHTCLYRVRLHGRDAEEDYEYGVKLKDPVHL